MNQIHRHFLVQYDDHRVIFRLDRYVFDVCRVGHVPNTLENKMSKNSNDVSAHVVVVVVHHQSALDIDSRVSVEIAKDPWIRHRQCSFHCLLIYYYSDFHLYVIIQLNRLVK